MKVCRRLGALLFGLGCAAAFIGLLSLLMNLTENAQLQLVIQSFYTDSNHAAVSLFNAGMAFCLSHAWHVLAVGALAVLAGSILLLGARAEPLTPPPRAAQRMPVSPDVPPQTKPAESINPFAVAVFEEKELPVKSTAFEPVVPQFTKPEPSVADFYQPLLEQNHVETGTISPFASPQAAREPVSTEKTTEDPVGLSAPKPLGKPSSPSAPAPENLSPRIRSTMGKRR